MRMRVSNEDEIMRMRTKTYNNDEDGTADNNEEKGEMLAVARCCGRA